MCEVMASSCMPDCGEAGRLHYVNAMLANDVRGKATFLSGLTEKLAFATVAIMAHVQACKCEDPGLFPGPGQFSRP